MKRILLVIFLFFCGGLILGLYASAAPPAPGAVGAILALISAVRIFRSRKASCLIYTSVFCLGMFMSSYSLSAIDRQEELVKGKQITIEGQISGEDLEPGKISKYTVFVSSMKSVKEEYKISCRVRVIDYRNAPGYIVPFNHVIISGTFTENGMFKNTVSRAGDWSLKGKGICGTLIADYSPGIESHKSSERKISKLLYDLKSGIVQVIERNTNKEVSGILKGILLGETSGIGVEEYEAFQKSGIVHAFAVSGYNIWLLYFILSKILFVLDRRMKIKTGAIILLLGLYAALTGAEPSVLRAFFMSVVMLLGKLLRKKQDPITSLSLAGMILLALNPLLIANTGFQLSFISTASIILLYPRLKKIRIPVPGFLKNALAVSLAAQIGILPLMLYYFNSFSIISIAANIIIMPMISILTITGTAICITGLVCRSAAVLLGYMANLEGGLVLLLTRLSVSIPFSNFNSISPSLLEMLLYYFGVALVFKFFILKDRWRKAVYFSAAGLLLLSVVYGMLPQPLSIHFIDVGQGDSILVSTPDRKNILIDGGGKPSSGYSSIDIGEDVLKPYLFKKRINRIDLMISTHNHEDHINGLLPVLSSFDTQMLVRSGAGNYEDLPANILPKRSHIMEAYGGDIIRVGKYVTLYVLSPDGPEEVENDASLVVKLVYGDFSVLFTGDISSEVEKELLSSEIEADVIKIPHHGSATSLDELFLDGVDPEAAVICVGTNSFGHPSQETLDKIKRRGIKLYRTDKHGEITIETRGGGFSVSTCE